MQNAYLENLSNKHRALENEIDQELARPLADTLKISALKRKKLRLKEKITKLEKKHTH